VFLGTAAFSVPALDTLVLSGIVPVAVYTRADKRAGRGRTPRQSPVKERALSLGIPVFQPISLRTPETAEELRRLNPTVLVLAAYGLLLPAPFLDIAPHGGLNIHPSLLPRHRGPSPVAWTLLEGDREAGVTIFLMDQGMDSGPILSQRRMPIGEGETTGGLTARLAREGADLIVETLRRWLRGEIVPEPQDESKATFSRLLRKEDGELDFHQPAPVLERRVRALSPWPGTFTRWNGQRLSVLRARAVLGPASTRPGAVVALPGGGSGAPTVGIGTAEGILGLLEVQAEGRRALPADEFIRGRRDFLGSLLPS
jgi:methionyl-tRNA formyltransferase